MSYIQVLSEQIIQPLMKKTKQKQNKTTTTKTQGNSLFAIKKTQ